MALKNYNSIVILKTAVARGRVSDSRLRGLRFKSCAAVLKPWAVFSLYIAPVHLAV